MSQLPDHSYPASIYFIYSSFSIYFICFISDDFNLYFIDEGSSPSSEEFPKRLGTFLGPRLSHLGSEIKEFVQRSRTQRYTDDYYSILYQLLANI